MILSDSFLSLFVLFVAIWMEWMQRQSLLIIVITVAFTEGIPSSL